MLLCKKVSENNENHEEKEELIKDFGINFFQYTEK